MVSETSFKFFVQFVFWAAFYWVYNLTVMAIFVDELRKEVSVLSSLARLFATQLRHTPKPSFQDLRTLNLAYVAWFFFGHNSDPWDAVVPLEA